MCNVRCTAQICYSWDSLEIQGAGVCNCLSLSERGGTTSSCRAGWHHISVWVPRTAGLNPVTSRIREGFGGLCARQKCSTCPGEHDMCCAGLVSELVLFCICVYVRMYVPVWALCFV